MTDTTSQDPGPQVQSEPGEKNALSPESKAIWSRLLFMILIGIMSGFAQTALNIMALVQFIVMLTGKGQPNDQIAHFGKTLGAWLSKAASFQTAASEDKPWPWSPLS